jgi:hypothetical protein
VPIDAGEPEGAVVVGQVTTESVIGDGSGPVVLLA